VAWGGSSAYVKAQARYHATSVSRPRVGGTFIWTPSHDQRPRSFCIAPYGCGPCRPQSSRSIAGGRLELLETTTTVTECDWMRSYGRA